MKYFKSSAVKPIYTKPHWDQNLCSEQTGVQFIQVKLTKNVLHMDFISSSAYKGFRFIQGSAQIGFTVTVLYVYANFKVCYSNEWMSREN